MTGRLLQIGNEDDGDGLYWTPDRRITEDMIKKWHNEYMNSDFESFEEFLDETHYVIERVFVEEIYI